MISVIMPVYNGEKYLRDAIESILNQTYTDFEFIILNDGSTDKTEEIILSYDDQRIVYVKNTTNLQISKTLNKGIDLAKGKYIARMDADDISLLERFERQIEFMEKYTEVGICGTYIETFDEEKSVWRVPLSHRDILCRMIFDSCLMHPSVMMRKSVLDMLPIVYREEFNKAEDYDLWVRLALLTNFANLKEVLLKYRIRNIRDNRKQYKNEQAQKANIIRGNLIKRLNISSNEKEIEIHNACINKECSKIPQEYKYVDWLLKIQNITGDLLNEQFSKELLINKYYEYLILCPTNSSLISRILGFLKLSKTKNIILGATCKFPNPK